MSTLAVVTVLSHPRDKLKPFMLYTNETTAHGDREQNPLLPGEVVKAAKPALSAKVSAKFLEPIQQSLVFIAFSLLLAVFGVIAVQHAVSEQNKGFDEMHLQSDAISNPVVSSNITIACIVMISAKDIESRGVPVAESWGARCTHLIFASTETNFSLLNMINVGMGEHDSYDKLSLKMHKGWQILFKLYPDMDYYMKADPDSYIMMDNLFAFLNTLNPRDDIYAGKYFRDFVAGACVIINRAAKNKVLPALQHSEPSHACSLQSFLTFGSGDDVAMARCMEAVGVGIAETRDSQGRERFLNFPLEFYRNPTSLDEPTRNLYFDWSRNKLTGPGCCAPDAVAFHYVRPEQLSARLEFKDGVWQWSPGVTDGQP